MGKKHFVKMAAFTIAVTAASYGVTLAFLRFIGTQL
jgi:hypothetical protein